MLRLPFIDSHTGGEPTRLILAGFPELGTGPLSERRALLLEGFDAWRRAILLEPRGHEALVAAILQPPERPESAFGLIFLNNAGALSMCGHGLIGAVTSLAFLGRIRPGTLGVDTPAGRVEATLSADGEVAFRNVESRVLEADLVLRVPGLGSVRGDLAWGGNGFFVVREHPLDLAAPPATLQSACRSIRAVLAERGLERLHGHAIDHIELIDRVDERRYRNFVLCPGGAYDRSPCGTGTSALIASLALRGELEPGATIAVESPIGSRFEASYRRSGAGVVPVIAGRAHLIAQGELLLDPADPFVFGMPLP
jgi:4-hydroxyproline epimerase